MVMYESHAQQIFTVLPLPPPPPLPAACVSSVRRQRPEGHVEAHEELRKPSNLPANTSAEVSQPVGERERTKTSLVLLAAIVSKNRSRSFDTKHPHPACAKKKKRTRAPATVVVNFVVRVGTVSVDALDGIFYHQRPSPNLLGGPRPVLERAVRATFNL